MRAVVLTAPGEVALTGEWPEPACGPGEVIVEIHGVGLCGSDLSVVAGHRAVPRLPWVLGHEAYGVVVAVGADVADRHEGQPVVVEPNYPCLRCAACRSGATSGCRDRRIVGITEPGLLAERVAVPAAFAWPVPGDWAAEDIVCVEPFSVARNAVELAGLEPGGRCLVIGAGSQGQLVCLAVRLAGGIVHVIEPHDGRRALAEELGARPDDGADHPIVIETSGAPSAFELAVARAAQGGTVIAVGQSTVPARVATFPIVQRRLTIRGCLIYDHPGGFARTLAAMAAGDARPGRILRARYPLAEAPRAFSESAGNAGKSWISIEERT